MNYTIIQPQTIEEVLASVCYIAYWNDTALRLGGHDVQFYEDCTFQQACDVLKHDSKRIVLIDISSPPQIQQALALWRKYRHYHDIRFIGYRPYSDLLGLPFYDLSSVGLSLSNGAHNYLYNIDSYRHAHATLDGHINLPDGDKRLFMPAFFGVGCLRGCEYCYISRTNYPYAFISEKDGYRLIDYMIERGWNIHFEDENFFTHPKAEAFVRYLIGKDTKWICITDSLMLSRAVGRMGVQQLIDTGHWLSEVGLETTDSAVIRKRQDISGLIDVQNRQADNLQTDKLNIFWLSVTLFPDDSIETMNRNGAFYAEHGMTYDRLQPRLKTQSSEGGCGQFFVPYPGTKFWPRVQSEGKWIAEPPLRLRPSWIGDKLRNDVPVVARQPTGAELATWLPLYAPSEQYAVDLLNRCDGQHTVEQVTQLDPEAIATLACLSRLRCIVPQEAA